MINATMPRNMPVMDDMSEESYNDALRLLDKELYYESCITIRPEDQLIQMVSDLPSGDQIETLINQLKEGQVLYIKQIIDAWFRAVEMKLGRTNTRVEKRFVELADGWHDETDFLSSPQSITNNDTYMKIISMGEAVIPCILKDMRDRGGYWYRALRILTGVDPVPAEVRGDAPKMKEAWINWGRDKGHIE